MINQITEPDEDGEKKKKKEYKKKFIDSVNTYIRSNDIELASFGRLQEQNIEKITTIILHNILAINDIISESEDFTEYSNKIYTMFNSFKPHFVNDSTFLSPNFKTKKSYSNHPLIETLVSLYTLKDVSDNIALENLVVNILIDFNDKHDAIYHKYKTKMTTTNHILLKILLDLNENGNSDGYNVFKLDTSFMKLLSSDYYYRQEYLKVLDNYYTYSKHLHVDKVYEEMDANTKEYRKQKCLLKCQYRQLLKEIKAIKDSDADSIKHSNDKLKYLDKVNKKIKKIELEFKNRKVKLDNKLHAKKKEALQENLKKDTIRKNLKNLTKSLEGIRERELEYIEDIDREYKHIKDSTSPGDKQNNALNRINEKLNLLPLKSILQAGGTHKEKIDQVLKSLKFLQAYNLITSIDGKYELNLEHWSKYQEHTLNSKLKENTLPLLIAFLKYNAPNNVDNFLDYIDEIIDALFESPDRFSDTFYLEKFILDALNNNKYISFTLIVAGKEENIKGVKDYELLFPEQSLVKILSYKDPTLNEWKDISLQNIVEIKMADQIEESSNIKRTQSFFTAKPNEKTNSLYETQKKKFNLPDRKRYHVILEVDMNLADFFLIRPLKEQVMYLSKSEKEAFCLENEINCKDKSNKNKFYVSVQDTKQAIFHTVQRCLPSATIVKPISIKDEFKNILKSYYDKQ